MVNWALSPTVEEMDPNAECIQKYGGNYKNTWSIHLLDHVKSLVNRVN